MIGPDILKREKRDLWLAIAITLSLGVYHLLFNIISFLQYISYQYYQSMSNLLFFWILALLWVAYRRWRNAVYQQRKLRNLLASVKTEVIMVVDSHRRIQMVNESVDIFGFSPEEVIKKTTDLLYLDRRVDNNRPTEILDTIDKIGFHIGEATGRKRTGETFPLEIVTVSLKGSEGVVVVIRDITERKRAEEALVLEKTFVDAIFNSAPGMLYLYDMDGKIVRWNKKHELMTGYSSEEMSQMRLLDWFKGDVASETAVTEGIKTTISKGYVEGEANLKKKDGTTLPMYFTASPLTINGKQYFTGLGVDISARKTLDTALRQSEERYRTILDEMEDGYHETDLAGRITFVNEAFLRICGFSAEELIGTNYSMYTSPEEAEKVYRAFNQMYKTGIPVKSLEMNIFIKNGNRRTLELYASVLRNENNHPTGFRGIIRDISERKRSEDKLRNSESKYQFLAESMADAVFTLDLNLATTYVSPSMEKMLGFTPAERMAQPVDQQLTPKSLKLVFETLVTELDREKESGTDPNRSRTVELEYYHKDGSIKHLVTYLRGIRDDEGHLTGVYGSHHDITKRKRAEEEREKLQEQLIQAQKMESVGRLAGGVAHDFNNMLGVILGRTEMAIMRTDTAQPLYNDLQEIQKAAERSADLTRQLLAFARRQTVAPKVLDLNKAIEGMFKILRRLIGENIDLAWRPTAGLALLKMDPGQIDQILANLCVNARDAIAGVVGKVTIETGAAVFDDDYCADHPGCSPGDYVLLAVSDNGCGMDKGTMNKLFEPFFTTKDVGQGTGLGLATVYGIVKQNNGFINVYSEPEQGTTFRIYLPQHMGKVEQLSKDDRAAAAEPGDETILLAEDDLAILEMTTEMLERLGYTVLKAHTPVEAIRLAEEHIGQISLLVTDVVMPGMNGRDLAKILLSRYPKLKRLFMSGYTANVIAHHGVLDEGVYFIQKPFSIQSLAIKVREALDK